jgi:hypothetical protein
MLKLNAQGLLLSVVMTMGTLAVIAPASSLPNTEEDRNNPDAKILYQETIDQLIQSGLDTTPSNRIPVPVDLLGKAWQAIGLWSLDFLNSSPDANVSQLIQRIEELNKLPKNEDKWQAFKLYTDAIRFDDGTRTVFVLSANFSRRGNVIIFQKINTEPFRLAWSIKDTARASKNHNINVWDDATDIWGGLLTGYADLLPKTSKGHPRFYLAATTHPWAGGTIAKEISVWEWTGKKAVPQFTSFYDDSIDSPGDIKLSGNLLKIGLKAEPKTFITCGSCVEPQATWNLKITPTGVEDVGTDFKQPEYKYIDELLYRIQKRENVRSMASGCVATMLRRAMDDFKKEFRSETPKLKDYSLGMLMGGLKTSRQGAHEIVSINIDLLGEMRFTLSKRNGQFYALDVQIPDWQ